MIIRFFLFSLFILDKLRIDSVLIADCVNHRKSRIKFYATDAK